MLFVVVKVVYDEPQVDRECYCLYLLEFIAQFFFTKITTFLISKMKKSIMYINICNLIWSIIKEKKRERRHFT